MTMLGRLATREASWQACAASHLIMGTVVHGYRFQFRKCPPLFRGIVVSKVHPSFAPDLRTLNKYLRKLKFRMLTLHQLMPSV